MTLRKLISKMTFAEGKKSKSKIGDVRELWARLFDLEKEALQVAGKMDPDGIFYFDKETYAQLSPVDAINTELYNRFGIHIQVSVVDEKKFKKLLTSYGKRNSTRKG